MSVFRLERPKRIKFDVSGIQKNIDDWEQSLARMEKMAYDIKYQNDLIFRLIPQTFNTKKRKISEVCSTPGEAKDGDIIIPLGKVNRTWKIIIMEEGVEVPEGALILRPFAINGRFLLHCLWMDCVYLSFIVDGEACRELILDYPIRCLEEEEEEKLATIFEDNLDEWLSIMELVGRNTELANRMSAMIIKN
mgnify:CR=1 FL=1